MLGHWSNSRQWERERARENDSRQAEEHPLTRRWREALNSACEKSHWQAHLRMLSVPNESEQHNLQFLMCRIGFSICYIQAPSKGRNRWFQSGFSLAIHLQRRKRKRERERQSPTRYESSKCVFGKNRPQRPTSLLSRCRQTVLALVARLHRS